MSDLRDLGRDSTESDTSAELGIDERLIQTADPHVVPSGLAELLTISDVASSLVIDIRYAEELLIADSSVKTERSTEETPEDQLLQHLNILRERVLLLHLASEQADDETDGDVAERFLEISRSVRATLSMRSSIMLILLSEK